MNEKIYKEGKFYDENGRHVNSIITEFDKDKFTKTELLERCWKSDLIEELLGRPDEEKPIMYGNVMKLYERKRVLEAEKTETFKTKRRKKRKK